MQTPGVDESFLRRVFWASVVLTALGSAVLALYVSGQWGLGFLVAGLWSAANLKALERLMRLVLRPEGRDKAAIVTAIVIKLPVLYGLGALIAIKGGFPAGSLAAGFSVPLLVVVLKIFGQLLAPKVALPDRRFKARDNGS